MPVTENGDRGTAPSGAESPAVADRATEDRATADRGVAAQAAATLPVAAVLGNPFPPDPLQRLSQDLFYEVADFVPMNEVMTLRRVSKSMKETVEGYIRTKLLDGPVAAPVRVLDPLKGFAPIDPATPLKDVIAGLGKRSLVRGPFPADPEAVARTWDKAIRALIREGPRTPYSPDAEERPVDVQVICNTSVETDSESFGEERRALGTYLLAYVRYCLERDLLVDAEGRPVSETAPEVALAHWTLNRIHYDQSKVG
ncbi:MAG TPA: hypothetical protein VFV01_29755 [Spirillospora sp.]|nr:hypothetical protein [Spirillospora sp.]